MRHARLFMMSSVTLRDCHVLYFARDDDVWLLMMSPLISRSLLAFIDFFADIGYAERAR